MAKTAGYYLTARDKELMKRIKREVLNDLVNAPTSGKKLPEPHYSNDCYVVCIPNGEHIPALTDGGVFSNPGTLKCELYHILHLDADGDTQKLVSIPFGKVKVSNIYRIPIIGVAHPYHYYHPVKKDKYGIWIPDPPHPLIAKNENSPISPNTDGTVTVYAGEQGEEETTGLEVTGWNRTGTAWGTDTFGSVDLVNGLPYLFPWEC